MAAKEVTETIFDSGAPISIVSSLVNLDSKPFRQILQDKLAITTLVQDWGKTELNAPKLKKLTKEDFIKFVKLCEVYVQSDGRDTMVELIGRGFH